MSPLAAVALAAGALAALRYAVALPFFVRYLRRARVRAIPAGPTPPLSLLKPLYGEDPGLEENLVATLRQNYPDFEVLFVHERPDDPALAAVAAARARVPDVAVRTIEGRAPGIVNPKVAALARGEDEARFDLVAAADADVRPDPLYLRDIANGLAEADVVSFPPVLFGTRTLPARLVALVTNTEAFLNLVVAGGRVTTGATIGLRRAALERIGGWRAVGDRIADDYAIGRAAARAGLARTLARRAARLYHPGGSFRDGCRHLVRWTRVVRTAAPLHYALAFPLAAAPLLLALAAALTAHAGAALTLLGVLAAVRAGVATVVDLRFCWDRSLVRSLPLLPVAWVVEPLLLVAGLAGRTVMWRGRRYRVRRGRATLGDP